MADRVVVVNKGGGCLSVFGGLFLFFVVMPICLTIGCLACTGGFIASTPAINAAKEAQRKLDKERAKPVDDAESIESLRP